MTADWKEAKIVDTAASLAALDSRIAGLIDRVRAWPLTTDHCRNVAFGEVEESRRWVCGTSRHKWKAWELEVLRRTLYHALPPCVHVGACPEPAPDLSQGRRVSSWED